MLCSSEIGSYEDLYTPFNPFNPLPGICAVITDELKDAVVAMMMRKDEVEEQMKFVCLFRSFCDSIFCLI